MGEKLGENEVKIIELMKDNKYITAKELSEHIKISTTLAFPPPSRGRIKVGVRYFLSLRTLIYQGVAISISPLSFPRLSACVHAQAGESGNPFSFVVASKRSERGNLNWSTGKPVNWLTKLIDGLNMHVFYNLIHKKKDFPNLLSY